MKYILALLALSTLHCQSTEWIKAEDWQFRLHDRCMFYDKTSDEIYIGDPIAFLMYAYMNFDIEAEITHLAPMPEKPQ